MMKTLIGAMIVASLPLAAVHAGNLPAVNQTHPTATVVTPSSQTKTNFVIISNFSVIPISIATVGAVPVVAVRVAGSGTTNASLTPEGNMQIVYPDGRTEEFQAPGS